MKQNYELDASGRICSTTQYPFNAAASWIDFPQDFDFKVQGDWRIENGTLVHDPLPKLPSTSNTPPSLEQRTDTIEDALAALILGGDANV